MVRSAFERSQLFALDQAIQALAARHDMNDPVCLQLSNIYHNLVRNWAELQASSSKQPPGLPSQRGGAVKQLRQLPFHTPAVHHQVNPGHGFRWLAVEALPEPPSAGPWGNPHPGGTP